MASEWINGFPNREDSIMDHNITVSRNNGGNNDALLKLKNDLYCYYLPLIVIIGIVNNFLCCLTLVRTDLRRKFFTHIYVAVYTADIGFLMTLLFIWMRNQGVDIYDQAGFCQMIIFMGYFFPFMSVWHSCLAALILLLRVRSIKMVKLTSGSGKAKILIILLAILSLTAYLYKTWTNGVIDYNGRKVCSLLPEIKENIIRILNVLDLFFIMILPFMIFIIFDLVILVKQISISCDNDQNGRSWMSGDAFVVIFAHSICFQLFVAPECISKSLLIIESYLGRRLYSQRDLIMHDLLNYSFYTYFAVKPMIHTGVSKALRFHIKQMVFGFRRKITVSKHIVPQILTEQTSV